MAYLEDIESGIILTRHLTDLLNEICKNEGGIGRDDSRIWDDYLHKLTEQEWDQIVKVLEALRDHETGVAYPQDETVIATARKALDKALATGESFVGKPNVARSGNKKSAWQITMTMREMLNRHAGVKIPNTPGSRPPGGGNSYGDLFD
jgi:hypothetical protein